LTHTPSSLAGVKRKADEGAPDTNGKVGKPSSTSSAGNETRKGPAPPLNAPKPKQPDKAPVLPNLEASKLPNLAPPKPSPTKANTPSTTAAKTTPAKGSYADLMARAKQYAEQRVQAPVGIIKHQDTVKKPTKFELKRKEKQERAKAEKSGKRKHNSQETRRSTSPQKRDEPKESNSTKAAPKAGYKGTMGMSTSHKRPYQSQPNQSKFDEYLGTDEEDDSDMANQDEGGYGSEGSDDMEAGFDDMEGEERMAERQAKLDDAKEVALENQLKREKEERRRRLQQMASKRR
jgi:hypothetical protein